MWLIPAPRPPAPRSGILLAAVCAAALTFQACGSGKGQAVPEQEITVACGSCIFKMEGAQGCGWAAEVDGQHYLVEGEVPHDHDKHGPDGSCKMPRQAKVEGRIHDGKLITTRFELLPAAGVPAKPKHPEPGVH